MNTESYPSVHLLLRTGQIRASLSRRLSVHPGWFLPSGRGCHPPSKCRVVQARHWKKTVQERREEGGGGNQLHAPSAFSLRRAAPLLLSPVQVLWRRAGAW